MAPGQSLNLEQLEANRAQVAELEKVRAMQVRKDAANFACLRYQGTGVGFDGVMELAAQIANFIQEG
jgi:NADH/NAD ratio-sensing transcriptional regulator Rex